MNTPQQLLAKQRVRPNRVKQRLDLLPERRSRQRINHMHLPTRILRPHQLLHILLLLLSTNNTHCLRFTSLQSTTSFPLATLNSNAANPVPPAAPLTVTKSPFFIPPRTFKPNAAVQKLIPNEAIASSGTVYFSHTLIPYLWNAETTIPIDHTLLRITTTPRKQTVHAITHIHRTRTVLLNHTTTHLQTRNERRARLLLVLPFTSQQIYFANTPQFYQHN